MLKAVDKLQIEVSFIADAVKVDIKDVQKAPNGQHLHRAVVTEGYFKGEHKSNGNRR